MPRKKSSPKRKVKKRKKTSPKAKKSQKRKKERKKEKTKKPFLIKFEKSPIISPKPENGWENWQTFNPGVILLENKVHFIYRAIGEDGISRFGYALSEDGFKIKERLNYPVYEHISPFPFFNNFNFASGGSIGGCEDPRLTRVNNEEKIYMIYTAFDSQLRLALTSIKVKDFLNKNWRWQSPVFISPPNEIHKNWVLFPEKIKGKYAILHSLNPSIQISYFENLEFDGKTFIKSYWDPLPAKEYWHWESKIKGVGPVPLKTKFGWLIFYHAHDKLEPEKYKVGAMLLDLNEPTKVIVCAKEPVIEPSEDFENNGFKPGVVYACGAVIKDEKLLVYYGGADNYVSCAWANLNDFLEALISESKPKLKLKKEKLKKKVLKQK